MSKINVLIIDDQVDIRENIKVELGEENYRMQTMDFPDYTEIAEIDPDIVILDLMKGLQSDNDFPGNDLHNAIWEKQFFPIVVYSAFDVSELKEHPFIKYIHKGKNSLAELVRCVKEYEGHIKSIKHVKKYINEECSNILKHIAPRVVDEVKDAEGKNETLIRMTRRRLAVSMDCPMETEKNILPWEQYVYPPVNKDIKMGDVLKTEVDGDTQYCLVLTPSCDLDTSNNRKIKVVDILVAECKKTDEEFLQKINVGKNKTKIDENLPRLLKDGYGYNHVLLPALKWFGIPSMAADLKQLKLIPVADIIGGTKYTRIVSVDSPFRELIAWAYMQTSCRPGLPDRNVENWSREIQNDCQNN